MKKLMLGLSLVLSVAFAHAENTDAQFYTADDSLDSQLCVIAANQGYSAALSYGKQLGGKYSYFTKDIVCNGLSIKTFAQQQRSQQKDIAEQKQVTFYAANRANESQICLQAVKSGLHVLAHQEGYVRNVKCNGQPIEKFVKQYRGI